MIKMTGNDIMMATPVLKELLNKSFKGATTFKLMRLVKKIDEESKAFESAREKLIQKYGKHKDDGELDVREDGTVYIQEDKIEECNKELLELVNTEVEINAEKLPASAFEEVDLTAAQALAIESLIDFE